MEELLYEKKGRVAYVTLNRPDQLNSLTPDLVDELARVWVDFRDDDSLRVAVLAGSGRAFCAGGDLKQPERLVPEAMGAPARSVRASSATLRANPAAYEVWKPVIAALRGQVVGAGLWMALGCDVRVAAEDTQLRTIEARRGMAAIVAAPMLNFLPVGIASELLLWGEPMNAQRAYEVGLVNRVVPLDRLMATATALAERVCENGPLAVRAMKEVLHRRQFMHYEEEMVFMEHAFVPVRASEDRLEGIRSFVEKRKPVWKGK